MEQYVQKNPKLAEKVENLRSHGIVKDPKLFKNKFYGPWSYEQQTLILIIE